MRGIRPVVAAMFVVSLAAVAACTATAEDRARTVCSTVCACQAAPTPNAQNACIDDCTNQVVSQIDLISEECSACITSHANVCVTLERDCANVCEIDQPPPPVDVSDAGVTPQPPTIPDAAPDAF